MIRVGVVGGSGYTGGELIRLILQHPSMELDFVYSRSKEGEKISTCHADLLGQSEIKFRPLKLLSLFNLKSLPKSIINVFLEKLLFFKNSNELP